MTFRQTLKIVLLMHVIVIVTAIFDVVVAVIGASTVTFVDLCNFCFCYFG